MFKLHLKENVKMVLKYTVHWTVHIKSNAHKMKKFSFKNVSKQMSLCKTELKSMCIMHYIFLQGVQDVLGLTLLFKWSHKHKHFNLCPEWNAGSSGSSKSQTKMKENVIGWIHEHGKCYNQSLVLGIEYSTANVTGYPGPPSPEGRALRFL